MEKTSERWKQKMCQEDSWGGRAVSDTVHCSPVGAGGRCGPWAAGKVMGKGCSGSSCAGLAMLCPSSH